MLKPEVRRQIHEMVNELAAVFLRLASKAKVQGFSLTYRAQPGPADVELRPLEDHRHELVVVLSGGVNRENLLLSEIVNAAFKQAAVALASPEN